MTEIDAAAPGVKPAKEISVRLQNAITTLSTKINGKTLGDDDLPLAHLYRAKAWYYWAVNDHEFTEADYDREDARAYVYEFEQAINMMWDQTNKAGKDWKEQIADANWLAGSMVVKLNVDRNSAYTRFFPACAALGRAECRKAMADAPK